MIIIRHATKNDIPGIMNFIDVHWRKSDKLAVDRAFFEWSFLKDDKVTFIIASDDNGDIYGIYGYMPYTSDDCPDCFETIWRVRKGSPMFLGQKMVEYLKTNTSMRYLGGAGLRKKAIELARIRGKKVICMDHYYRLNSLEEYHIADIKDHTIPPIVHSSDNFFPIKNMDDFKKTIPESILENAVFRKNYEYIKHRYFDHPLFKYELWCIQGNVKTEKAVIVTREEEYDGHKSWKLIDYYGDEQKITIMAQFLDQIMVEREYEFIDVYSYGINTELYLAGGFLPCDDMTENVIPNYFRPYEKKNVNIYMFEPSFEGLKLFRGDGDQDRPC